MALEDLYIRVLCFRCHGVIEKEHARQILPFTVNCDYWVLHMYTKCGSCPLILVRISLCLSEIPNHIWLQSLHPLCSEVSTYVCILTVHCNSLKQLTQCKDTDPCHPALLWRSCSSLTPMPCTNSRRERSNDISWDEGIPGIAKLGFRRLSITLETITTDRLGDIGLEWVANVTQVNQVEPSKRSGSKIISKLCRHVKDIECSRIC